ncbi:hypothetical protein QQ054_22455 [Oscillatoria amoena NRMC-F 0135]|nr:hypothetical protein [Cyclobacteriaceae bacterium]MDL5048779.1 hypothetical protein [Oscillatoria amoena NRMC-F 0135]
MKLKTMGEVLIARFKNKREADAVTRLIRKHSASSTLVRGKSLEDLWLAEMINEGMKEKRTHSIAAFEKKLDKQIKRLAR